jgi:hypothetical protein
MGLFDMFGAGGGSVAFQLQSPMVQAGSAVTGNIVFTGGSRAQQITKITLKLTQETRSMQMTNTGPQPHTASRDVVPMFQVTGGFTSTPGQPTAFPFQIPVPQGAPNTVAGQVTYHLRCAVDIDNEVDPGSAAEIQVVGGMQQQMGMPGNPMMQQGMGMPMQQGMGMPMQQGMGMPMQQGMGMPMQQGMGMPMQQGMGMPMQQGMQIAPGTHVLAQWGGDGQMHPGRVVGFQNGMYGVDWDEPRLGATTYVYQQQLQLAGQMGMQKGMDPMHKGNDPMHKGNDPMHKGQDPYAQKGMDPMHKGQDPYAQKGMDPMHKGQDPYAQKGMDPMHKGQDPYAQKGADPMHKGMGMPQQQQGHVTMGTHVLAQHPSGQWAPGRVAAMQNGMIGVDWDDPKLGQSTWVQPTQVRQK